MRHSLPAGAILFVATACTGGPPTPPTPTAACSAVWADTALVALVEQLETATATQRPVWGDYDLGDGWYVIFAGESVGGGACLGAWTGGRAVAYGQVPEPPRLSTPLYGFYLPRDDRGAVPSRGTQPAAVASWLESVGANRATIVPAAIDDFPMELSSLAKLQVALHEGFHVQVQSPHWAGRDPAGGSRGRASSGPGWPAWDRQPDRTGLPRCYRSTKEVAAAAEAERAALTGMVESLLDGVPTAACRAGAEFLDRRQARYRLMTDVAVARADSTPGTCREAEAVMELEEGTADYASWTQLFELGLVSRAGLMRRYRAVQNDVFYLTGAMQLHAIALMRPEGMADVARRIGRSGSPEEGSITTVFTAVLDTYCGR